jgi:TonB family protein
MYKVLAAIVVASLSVPAGSAQSSQDPWPPPGVVTAITPGVTRPQLVTEVRPQYSAEAMRRRLQGVVTIACVVETDGTVGAARVIQSLDKQFGLDDQALAAAKQWRFRPGTKDGATVRVLVTLNLTFAIKGEPPPSTWPAFLTNDKTSAIDVSQWRDHMEESGKLVVKIRYPPAWTIRPASMPGSRLGLSGPDGEESMLIMAPRALPGPMPQPIGLDQLQFFSDTMRRSAGGLQLDSLGIGQALSGSNWWIWQELDVPTSHFDRAAIQVPEIAAFSGARMWHFTTIVGNEMVLVFVNRLIGSGRTPEMIESELRASGQTFDQILRRMTFSTR